MRFVRPAMAASTISGDEIAKSPRVVFAEPDEVDAEFVGEHRLVDDVADGPVHAAPAGHRRPP